MTTRNKMKKEIYSLLILISTLFTCCNNNDKQISFPILVGERPESITKGFNGNYYVTMMNAKETGDGGINEISPGGVRSFFRGADEPKGIVYLNDHLYFSDVTRVWKVDKFGKGEVFVDQNKFPKQILYLNDVSLDSKGNGVFVADMGATKYMRDEKNEFWPLDSEEANEVPSLGRVYHIDLNGKVTIAQDTNKLMTNPNGVGIDNNGNLMITCFFKGNILVNRNGALTPLKGIFRGADAIEQDQNGHYYVSSWTAGKTWKLDKETEEATILIEGLESAADFYLEEEKNRLLLPDMMTGKIHAVSLGE